jgi:multiple sugar transport system substrate-binding protein
MRRRSAWFGFLVCAGLLGTIADAADGTGRVVFLSTQLRPIGEAQKMRNLVLKEFSPEVDYITDLPQRFLTRIESERQVGMHTIDVVGALHGELQPLAALGALVPLDDLAGKLASHGIPDRLLALGRFGSAHQLYMPWMQAGYIMVANKQALPYLPSGADINALTYDQLGTWARTLQQETGKRLLGFPAGPHGLMHRFLEGFLYPSYTGGVVVPFRSEAAEAMWTQFASLWRSVNPNSTSYDFMDQPLLSGDVWIGFDHIARVLGALRQKPNEFVAFPAPAGPKGRGYMPLLAGLAVVRGAPDIAESMALIDYLTEPGTQITLARTVGFFPVVSAELPPDLDPGLKMGAGAIAEMQSAKDALPALPPVGFGDRDAEFDSVFLETFQLIVLRGQKTRPVLDREAETLKRLIGETGASCWQPDPPSTGACLVQ